MITLTLYDTYIEIDPHDIAADIFKVKQLPGRWYDPEREVWIVPVRPGLSKAIKEVFGADTAAAMVEEGEAEFMKLIAPPPPGSVDPWKVSANVAVELATMHHFYNVHDGDREDEAKNHPSYRFGE